MENGLLFFLKAKKVKNWISASEFVRDMGYGISNNTTYEVDYIAALNPFTISGTPSGDYDGAWFGDLTATKLSLIISNNL